MPIGDADWLAQTQEPVLEPDLPICDPHHHFWVHRPRLAYQQYLLAELAEDINSGHNVRSTVFIDARSEYRTYGPEELRSVGEVEFVQKLADESASGTYGPARAAAAIIGRADLKLGEEVRPVLEALQAASPNRFRGVRHMVGWDPSPEVMDWDIQGVLATDGYRTGGRILAEMGFLLENYLYVSQLDELADFANAVPDLTIVLNHLGGLARGGPDADRDDEVLAEWRRGVANVARCPNIIMKLGGLGRKTVGEPWSEREVPVGSGELADSLAPLMNYCIEQFGPDRCMFESNFPVDKVFCSYNVLYNAFKRLSRGYSASERAAMFHDTAARVYSIDV